MIFLHFLLGAEEVKKSEISRFSLIFYGVAPSHAPPPQPPSTPPMGLPTLSVTLSATLGVELFSVVRFLQCFSVRNALSDSVLACEMRFL